MNLVRRLAYNPKLRGTVRTLHLSGAMRDLYWRFMSSPEGAVSISACGVSGSLYAKDPRDLRNIEDGFLREDDFLKALSSSLRPGDVFLDVGAQRGVFSILVAKVVGPEGKVIALEPEGRAYEVLQKNIALNNLTNVRTFRKALGDSKGTGRLFIGGSSCPSLMPNEGDPDQRTASESIDIVRGDWLMESEGLPIPHAVKVDVEGYEYSVIQGFRATLANPACVLLCCEIHPAVLPADVTVEKLLESVRSLGFLQIQLPPHSVPIHMVARKGPAGHGAN